MGSRRTAGELVAGRRGPVNESSGEVELLRDHHGPPPFLARGHGGGARARDASQLGDDGQLLLRLQDRVEMLEHHHQHQQQQSR